MYLIQLLLPLYDNAKQPFPHRLFQEIHQELLERFGGLTAYTRAPAAGLWQDQGDRTVRDDVVIHEVMTNVLDREWWKDYRAALAGRFQQDTIVVRAQEIQLL